MKTTKEGIEFSDLKEFSKFITDLDLLGIIQLREALKDKKGNILIKELVYIRDSSIKKLESISDQYIPIFKVQTNSELIGKIRKKISQEVTPVINETEKSFISILFTQNVSGMKNTENLIGNSFYSDNLVLTLYEIMIGDKDFFQHIIRMGLLCLGTVIQKNYAIKLIHRNAFLTGLCADLIFFKTNYWKNANLDDSLMLSIMKLNITIANNIVRGLYVVESPDNIDIELLKQNPFFQNPFSESEKKSTADNEYYADTIKVLTEALKITRFISEANKNMEQNDDDIVQKLIVMFAYNVEKKNFDEEIANPMISCFRQYEKVIKRTRKIAQIENQCLHPPSAWAYPKPKASQVLCKNNHHTCPHYVSGWNISVISTQEAIGYIGTNLRPGSYPKCRLEKDLEDINK